MTLVYERMVVEVMSRHSGLLQLVPVTVFILSIRTNKPRQIYLASILHKSIAGRYRPVRVTDGPITARYRFIKNASWVIRRDVYCLPFLQQC